LVDGAGTWAKLVDVATASPSASAINLTVIITAPSFAIARPKMSAAPGVTPNSSRPSPTPSTSATPSSANGSETTSIPAPCMQIGLPRNSQPLQNGGLENLSSSVPALPDPRSSPEGYCGRDGAGPGGHVPIDPIKPGQALSSQAGREARENVPTG